MYSVHKPVLRVTILLCMAHISKPIYCLYGELAAPLIKYWKIFHFASSLYRKNIIMTNLTQIMFSRIFLDIVAGWEEPVYIEVRSTQNKQEHPTME